jgi:hypothetical protein
MSRLRPVIMLGLALTFACADGDADGNGDDTIVVGEPAIEGTCADDEGRGDAFADCIDAFSPAPGVDFGHDELPDIVLGPPVIAAPGMGSLDVASLGCGGRITLGFDPPGIEDGDGVDLLVFENAFTAGMEVFVEPAQVLVSDDGVQWRAFECEPGGEGHGCAGVHPTLALDPAAAIDPARAGGDGFDLADVGLPQARWVRLVDRTAEHYGDEQWCGGAAGGFDLDAIAAVPP